MIADICDCNTRVPNSGGEEGNPISDPSHDVGSSGRCGNVGNGTLVVSSSLVVVVVVVVVAVVVVAAVVFVVIVFLLQPQLY